MSEFVVESSNARVDVRFRTAIGEVCLNMAQEIRVAVTAHTRDFGRRPEQVVVLAGTNVVAALSILCSDAGTRPAAWSYDRETGVLSVAWGRITAVVCEHPTIDVWDIQVLVPGDVTLGRARVHTATVG